MTLDELAYFWKMLESYPFQQRFPSVSMKVLHKRLEEYIQKNNDLHKKFIKDELAKLRSNQQALTSLEKNAINALYDDLMKTKESDLAQLIQNEIQDALEEGEDINLAEAANRLVTILKNRPSILGSDAPVSILDRMDTGTFSLRIHLPSDNELPQLFKAIRDQDIEAVRDLLEKGAPVNQALASGVTPLLLAIDAKNVSIVQLLLSQPGINLALALPDGKTPLFKAILDEQQAIALLLIEKDKDNKVSIDLPEKTGWTPLLVAAQEGNLEVVKRLVALGADVKHALSTGLTPFLKAVMQGHKDIIKLLHQEDKNSINQDQYKGKTALLHAVISGKPEIVDLLIKLGANVNQPSATGRTPLMEAVIGGNPDIVRTLLSKSKRFLNDKYEDWTPLLLAVENNNLEVVKVLLQHGADIEIRLPDGDNAYSIALSKAAYEICNALAYVKKVNHAKPLDAANLALNYLGDNESKENDELAIKKKAYLIFYIAHHPKFPIHIISNENIDFFPIIEKFATEHTDEINHYLKNIYKPKEYDNYLKYTQPEAYLEYHCKQQINALTPKFFSFYKPDPLIAKYQSMLQLVADSKSNNADKAGAAKVAVRTIVDAIKENPEYIKELKNIPLQPLVSMNPKKQ